MSVGVELVSGRNERIQRQNQDTSRKGTAVFIYLMLLL